MPSAFERHGKVQKDHCAFVSCPVTSQNFYVPTCQKGTHRNSLDAQLGHRWVQFTVQYTPHISCECLAQLLLHLLVGSSLEDAGLAPKCQCEKEIEQTRRQCKADCVVNSVILGGSRKSSWHYYFQQ